MCCDQDIFAAANGPQDCFAEPGQGAGRGILETLSIGRRDIEASTPDMYLLVAVFLGRLSLVEALKVAVMALVKILVSGDGQLGVAHRRQSQREGVLCPLEIGGETSIDGDVLGQHPFPGGRSLLSPQICQWHVFPTRGSVLEIPLGLSMAK